MAPYPSVVERYYKKYYYKYEDKPDQDICVLVHSNKVCLVTLTPEHKVFQHGPIKSIDYVIETGGKKVRDLHGKRKLEAIKTELGTPLCEITAGDGTVYTIDSPVRGKVLELNDSFESDLSLLDKEPETDGYIAILLHQHCKEDFVCNYLLTEEQYKNGETLQYSKNQLNKKNKAERNSQKMDVDNSEKELSQKRKDDVFLDEVDIKRHKTNLEDKAKQD